MNPRTVCCCFFARKSISGSFRTELVQFQKFSFPSFDFKKAFLVLQPYSCFLDSSFSFVIIFLCTLQSELPKMNVCTSTSLAIVGCRSRSSAETPVQCVQLATKLTAIGDVACCAKIRSKLTCIKRSIENWQDATHETVIERSEDRSLNSTCPRERPLWVGSANK